jgi:hypothetical protein
MEHNGKLAEIEGETEDGIITLTSAVFADDTVNMGADNENDKDRGKTAQEFSDYAGCHTNAGKSFLGALRKRNKWSEGRAKQVERLTKQAMEEIMEENERVELTKSGDYDGCAEDSDSAEGDLLEVEFGTGSLGMKIMQVHGETQMFKPLRKHKCLRDLAKRKWRSKGTCYPP